jgi:hypothetical protein
MAKRTSTPAEQKQSHQRYGKRRAKAQAKVEARQAAEVRRLEGLGIVNPHAAGIDSGSWSHWVGVGAAAPQEFPAPTDGLHAIVAYLHQQQVTTVAMESTGVYWMPL